MDLKEIWREDMEWINLDQDTDQWCSLVDTVINFGFHKVGEIP
jgi:ethanolamine utilization protein EutA (predicted chaperonin)